MYVKRDRDKQKQIKFVGIEDLVPRAHILRDIEKSADFSFICDEVKSLYSEIE